MLQYLSTLGSVQRLPEAWTVVISKSMIEGHCTATFSQLMDHAAAGLLSNLRRARLAVVSRSASDESPERHQADVDIRAHIGS